MVQHAEYEVHPIGVVDSPLTDLADAPKQGDEGSPQAILDIDPEYANGLASLAVGDQALEFVYGPWKQSTNTHRRPQIRRGPINSYGNSVAGTAV